MTMATSDKKRSSLSKGGRSYARASAAKHGDGLLTAYQRVRNLIVDGRLSPGTWVVEADLAARLGMSRTPIRGALQWLQREGYLQEHRNVSKSRMVVAPLTQEDADELYAIVGALEGLAARRTALLPRLERQEMALKLSQLNDGLKAICREQEVRGASLFDLDAAFHDTIVQAGAGSRLMANYNAIKPQIERYWRLYATSITRELQESIDEHEAVIAGIQAGDADRTEAALRANWENGARRIQRIIELHGERGTW